jgi:hypothetical protein
MNASPAPRRIISTSSSPAISRSNMTVAAGRGSAAAEDGLMLV